MGKRLTQTQKNVKIEKNTRESSKHHTHTKDFKVEWMDFYGTMKSLLVKFTSVFLLLGIFMSSRGNTTIYKSPNFIRTKERHRITYVLVS